jgi:uncharacterized protein YkwD
MRRLVALVGGAILFLVITMPVWAAPPSPPSGLQVGGFPGGQIRLAWTDNSATETSFHLERSVNNRNNYTLLTTLPANTTLFTDTTVALNTTYWYRVQACNGDGCSVYAKDSFNVSFAANTVPNLDERYMLFLVNEARAEPAAFGYPAYGPRPPVIYNALLNYAAHSHSQAILNSDFTIGHCYPDPPNTTTEYRCPTERARDVGYIGSVSENLIAGGNGWDAVERAHQAFMDSLGHRNNLLDVNAKEAGMGHAYSPGQTSSSPGQYTHTFCGWNPVPAVALPAGLVVPYWGRSTTAFTFLVNFYNAGGSGPTQANVVIDGAPHAMTLRHGAAANGSYAYTTTLSQGNHTYYFDFRYGSSQSARLPSAGVYNGPDVEVDAAVLEVPDEYSTLAEALAYAHGDVIVQLAEGTFPEVTPINIPDAGIWIQGAGLDRTIIQGDGSGHVLEAHVDSLIRDLTITGSGTASYFDSGIWNTRGHVELRNVRITGNNFGIFSWCFSADCEAIVTISNSIFDHNSRAAINANDYPIYHLTNNTIASNGQGVILNNSASLVENSIIVSNSGDGLVGNNKSPTVRYNDVWGNGQNYRGITAGLGDLSVDPLFEAENSGDYRLQVDSPVIDMGNPAPAYNDRDGSRNDMGAYGGPFASIALYSRASAPTLAQAPFTVSWQGYATHGVQNYDIQYRVGTGGIWIDWLTQTTNSSAQFGPTEPVSLTWGSTYYFRSRIRDMLGNVESYPVQADAQTLLGEGFFVHLPVVLKQ